jgi:hypothetical protein
MNTVEERLARYRYELEATADAGHVDDVSPALAPRPDGRRAIALLTAAALVVVGLIVLNNRSIGHTPASAGGSAAFSWTTSRVVFTSNTFTIDVGGQQFSPTGVHVDVHTDPGNATYATLELSWQQSGVLMNVNVYFAADAANWWVTEMRTSNGKAGTATDWVTFMGDEFRTPLGHGYAGDVDLTATEGGVTSHLRIGGMTLELLPYTGTVTASSVPPNYGTLPSATAVVDATSTTFVLDPKADVQEPEQWYTVADPKDTVATIAAMFGLGAGPIAVWNGWTDGEAHVLTAGSTVRIPPGGTIVPNAVVPYGSLQVTPNDKPVLVGATNDLTGMCLLTATEIAGCDTVELPTPPVLARAVANANANATTTLIYGIADAGREVTIQDRAGTTIGQAVLTPAYHDRRAFAVLVPKTADGHYKVVQTQPDGTQFWVPIIL